MNGTNDTVTVRIVAIALAVLAGLALVLGAALLWVGVDASSTAVIFTTGGVGVGGLASLLASTSQRPPAPTIDHPAIAVPVVEAPVEVVAPEPGVA